MELTFEKWEDGRWFVILPEYDGDQEDLEMVDGADLFLDYLMEISSQVASAAHVESHARILAEKKSSNVTFIILSTDYWWNWLIKYMKSRAKEDLQLLSPAF